MASGGKLLIRHLQPTTPTLSLAVPEMAISLPLVEDGFGVVNITVGGVVSPGKVTTTVRATEELMFPAASFAQPYNVQLPSAPT